MSIWSLLTQRSFFVPPFLRPQAAQPARPFSPRRGLLLPLGGGYAEVLPGVAETLYARARGKAVHVTLLPASFSTDPLAITLEERARNVRDAEARRAAVETSLQALAPAGLTCRVALAPVFVRADAWDPANLRYFGRHVDAVFLTGGDQSVAMRVVGGTPVETALRDHYARGGVIAGTSAGAGMQSRTMLAGFAPGHRLPHSLHGGAATLWMRGEQRGLDFGVREAVFDQHFFQRGRMGRLLEAISRPGAPGLGVGIDAYTGVRVERDRLDAVFGLYSVAVLDMHSQGSLGAPRLPGKPISVRNVLVHLLGPGSHSYHLRTRTHSLAPRPRLHARRFEGLQLPPGAGPLFLCGGLAASSRTQDGAWAQFAALDRSAGQVIAAAAPECVDEAHLAAACAAWWAGAPLWLEGAAAAWAGAWRCTGTAPRTAGDPEDLGASEAAQIASARAVLADSVPLTRGLGLLPVGIEPRVLEDAGWNRLFSLAYAHPVQPAFGIGSGTTLVVTAAGARVLGSESVLSLDLRLAARTRARNGAYVVANGLLDVFAPGDDVSPVAAPAGLVSLRRIQRQRIPRPERSAVGWS